MWESDFKDFLNVIRNIPNSFRPLFRSRLRPCPEKIYPYNVNNRNIRKGCEICSQLTIKIDVFCWLYCLFWTYFLPFSNVSIAALNRSMFGCKVLFFIYVQKIWSNFFLATSQCLNEEWYNKSWKIIGVIRSCGAFY